MDGSDTEIDETTDTSNESNRELVLVRDRFNITYIIFFVLGISTLLPYNFFIISTQYFDYKLRYITNDSSIAANTTTNLQKAFINAVNISANTTTTIAIILNTLYGYKILIRLRILCTGVLIFTFFALTTIFVYIDTDKWQTEFFIIILMTVICINANSAIYGCSIYGYVSVLPPMYTQAVCMGQSFAALFASSTQILTLLFASSPQQSGFIYFMIACCFILMSLFLFLIAENQPFVKYYRQNFDKKQINYSINGDIESNDTTPVINAIKNVKKPTFEFDKIKATFKQSWFFLLIIWYLNATTYSVYPAVYSMVKPTTHADNKFTRDLFTPSLFVAFSVGDLTSRFLSGFFQIQKPKWIAILSFARIVFIPLSLFCNIKPRSSNITFFGDAPFFTIVVLGAFAYGYNLTLCLMYLPKTVNSKLSELVSSMGQMTLMAGIVSGSLIALLITTFI